MNPLLTFLGFISFSLSTFSAELSSSDLLAEQLVAHRYNELHATLEGDAAVLVDRLSLDEEVEIIDGENRLRLLLLTTLSRLPLDKISDPEWTREHQPFLDWLFTQPECLSLLATEIRPEDKGHAVLACWSKIWTTEENPEFRTKYANLALALALLYDSPDSVKKAKDQRYYPALTMIERYAYFRDASESGRLDTRCSKMSVRDLVRVIDSNVSEVEIEWVHKSISGSRSKAGNNYSDIEYLMERAVNNYNPYSNYILSEIKKHGGICGDQAHYSSNAAKVRGIPAMTVVGTGDRGPHAWLAFMPNENEWANYGSQGITNGKTYCTQRGTNISTRLLRLESLEDYEPDEREPVLLHLTLARTATIRTAFETSAFILERAKRIGKFNWEIWQEQEHLLLAANAGAEKWQDYFQEVERTFDDYSNILEWSLKLKIKHLFTKLPEEDRMKLLDREIRSIARELGSEEDALITVVDRIAGMLAAQKEEDAVESLYSRSFRRYGEDLELFNKLVSSYLKHGSSLPNLGPRIPDELHKAYKRVVETNSKELFRAQMELKILRRIAKSYSKLGDAEAKEKAGKINKGIARRKEVIERAAL